MLHDNQANERRNRDNDETAYRLLSTFTALRTRPKAGSW